MVSFESRKSGALPSLLVSLTTVLMLAVSDAQGQPMSLEPDHLDSATRARFLSLRSELSSLQKQLEETKQKMNASNPLLHRVEEQRRELTIDAGDGFVDERSSAR